MLFENVEISSHVLHALIDFKCVISILKRLILSVISGEYRYDTPAVARVFEVELVAVVSA